PQPPAPAGLPTAGAPTSAEMLGRQRAAGDIRLWETSKTAAQRLEQSIRDALSAAAAADARARDGIDSGMQAARDFVVTAAGGPGASSADMALLGISGQLSAGGIGWSHQLGDRAAALARQAASDPARARQLEREYGLMAKGDLVFAARVLNDLGPEAMLALVTRQANRDISAAYNQPGGNEPVASLVGDQALAAFLYNALASGTAGTLGPADPGAAGHVAGSYLRRLEAAGSHSQDGVPGYWALGTIFAAAGKGDVAPPTVLLTSVGEQMIAWTRAHHAFDIGPSQGVVSQQDNPLVGLMNAASLNPHGTQTLLLDPLRQTNGQPVHGHEPSNNLTWLLAKANWAMFAGAGCAGGDGGAALGHAIEVAGAGPSTQAAAITSQTVHLLAQSYAAHPGYASDMSGLQEPIAALLAGHIGAVNDVVTGGNGGVPGHVFILGGQPEPSLGFADLARVCGAVSQDPVALHSLQAAQVSWLHGGLGAAAAQWKAGQGPDEFLATAQNGTATLAFFTRAQAAVAQQHADASTARLLGGLNDATYATQAASLMPAGPEWSIPVGITSSVLGDVSGTIHASQAATVAGNSAVLGLPTAVNQMAAQAIIDHGLNSARYLPNPATPGQWPFLDGSGHLVSPTQFAQHPDLGASLNSWLNGRVAGTPYSENPDGGFSTVSNAVLSGARAGYSQAGISINAQP
ncbi:MAG: DUF6571 family protein, partial [Acidimicrobiales bacterium]